MQVSATLEDKTALSLRAIENVSAIYFGDFENKSDEKLDAKCKFLYPISLMYFLENFLGRSGNSLIIEGGLRLILVKIVMRVNCFETKKLFF